MSDLWIGRLRLASGLTLFAFVLCHFLNHAIGLISLDAMQAANPVFLGPWYNPVGNGLLVSAFLVHFAIGLRSVYRRRSLAMARWEWGQVAAGLAIPPLLFAHVLATAGGEAAGALTPTYPMTIAALWVAAPWEGVKQGVALLVVWTHAMIGLGFWLRLKPGWRRWRRAAIGAALVIPTLALAGYVSAGAELLDELERDHMLDAVQAAARFDEAAFTALMQWQPLGYAVIAGLLALPFAARALRAARAALQPRPAIALPDGRTIRLPAAGASVLEGLRTARIPHAAQCGGRGRCTTCRVRVLAGRDALPAPEEVEAAALARISAPPGVRLACQMRPSADLAISPLLPANAGVQDGRLPGGLAGEERRVTALFIDLRRSTKLGEERLPYDVLFILNQFFAEMADAVAVTGGHYAQFNGDGLMALYGLQQGASAPTDAGAAAALAGAREMLTRLDRLNKALESELPFPLEVGIGLHSGEAIVGAMGPPQAQMTTAIGDTINIAARLEGLTKEYGAPVILSLETARLAGLSLDGLTRDAVALRGRDEPLAFVLLKEEPAAAVTA